MTSKGGWGPKARPPLLKKAPIFNQQKISVPGFISGFLKSDKIRKFSELGSDEDKVGFVFEHEAFWPIAQVWLNY